MEKFKFEKTGFEGLYVIEPAVRTDARGYFMETYRYSDFCEAGLCMSFVQDNQSGSKRGVLRGLHYQRRNPQGKLVRVLRGAVYDVAVDLRRDRNTFGKYFGLLLTAENRKFFYIPEGFAHGFLVVSDEAEFAYRCTNYYDPADESGLMWNDPDLAIDWPVAGDMRLLLSEKDRTQPSFRDCLEREAF